MKKYFAFLLLCFSFFALKAQKNNVAIDKLMTDWHRAAAIADFDAYFGALHENSIYMGTDATERWTKKEFIAFAKPFFDRKKAWDFKAIDRHIALSKDGKTAWIDEVLSTTNMSLCRGSGVLILENGKWKIMQYVLSMTIPNEISNEVTKLKTDAEKKVKF